MKKLLIGLGVFLLALPIILVLLLQLGWSSVIAPKIQQQAIASAKEAGFDLKMQKPQLQSFLLPIVIDLPSLEVIGQKQGLKLHVTRANIQISPRGFGFSLAELAPEVNVLIEKPQVVMRLQNQEESTEKKATSQGSGGKAAVALPVALKLQLKDGNLSVLKGGEKEPVKMLEMKDLKVFFQFPELMGSKPGYLGVESNVHYNMASLPIPIKGTSPLKVESKNIVLQPEFFSLQNFIVSFGGVKAKIQGQSKSGSYDFSTVVDVSDLAELKKGGLLPEGQWKGGLGLNLKISGSKNSSPNLSGKLQLKKIRGAFKKNMDEEGVRLGGGLLANGSLEFEREADLLKKLEGQLLVDLTSMGIYKKDLFYKKQKVPLKVQVQSSLKKNYIYLKNLSMELAQLKGRLSGYVATQANQSSRLQMELEKASLNGLENILLPLKAYPVKGEVAFRGETQGDLKKPESLNLDLKPLKLQISSGIDYSDDKKTKNLSGPFQVNLDGNLSLAGRELQSANIKGKADFSKMKIQWADLFQKSENQVLNMDFKGQKSGESFKIENLKVFSFIGDLSTQGSLSDLTKPNFDIKGSFSKVNLKKLRGLVSSLSQFPLDGVLSGQFGLKGRFDPDAGIEKSPMQMTGVIKHQADSLVWRSPNYKKAENATVTLPNQSEAPKLDPKPILPDWPIVKSANVQLISKIDQVDFNDLKGDDFSLNAMLAKGILSGEMSFRRILSGQFSLSQIKADLYQVPTYLSGTATTRGIDLKEAVTWGVPEQKDLVKGLLSGQFQVKTPFPSHADPLKNTVSSGGLEIDGFEVSTLKLDEMINGLLARIPGLKDKKSVRTDSVKALFKSSYKFSDGVLTFTNLDFLTPQDHQLLANGTFDIQKNLNLRGKMFVKGIKVDPTVAPCLLDSRQRLEVPIEYQGLITQPKMTYATKAVEQVGKKYLECEAKKQLKKVEQKAKKEVDKVIKKEGKKLEEKLKKGLKDIFK